MKGIKNKGFSLIELLLVVGFISVASISGYKLYTHIEENRIISNEIEDMQRILLESKYILASNPAAHIDNTLLSNMRILPPESLSDNNNYINTFKNEIEFTDVQDPKTKRTTHLQVKYINMNPIYCSKIIPKYEKMSDFISLNIQLLKNNFEEENLNFDLSKTLAICAKEVEKGSAINMIFVFHYK